SSPTRALSALQSTEAVSKRCAQKASNREVVGRRYRRVPAAVQHMVEAIAQHRLGEAARGAFQPVELVRRALGCRARERLELDLRREVEPAAHRAQRVGQAFLFPAVGLASLLVEKIQ